MHCVVCQRRIDHRCLLCRYCRSSLDRVNYTTMDVIVWAAERSRRYEKMRSKVVNVCSCGRFYTRDEWNSLELIGEMSDSEERVELRNCICGSTRSINLPLKGKRQ